MMIPATAQAEGFYWVRVKGDKHIWTVAFWTKRGWRKLDHADVLEVGNALEGPSLIK